MASENAKNAAKKVLETIGKGEKVVLGKILRETGYADNTADNPILVTSTDSYQDEVAPFVKKLEKERDRIIKAMTEKDLTDVQYQHLTAATDTLTKNIQLLGGKETEKVGITINTVNYGDTSTV
jgi:hypothetical protein